MIIKYKAAKKLFILLLALKIITINTVDLESDQHSQNKNDWEEAASQVIKNERYYNKLKESIKRNK